MQEMNTHEQFMKRAIEFSVQKMKLNEGGPFGAVIVKDNKIIGEGWNKVTSQKDPTAHAEVSAIRHACQQTGHFKLEGAILYTSCEPCPMCLAAAYWARISEIYYASDREIAAKYKFDDSYIYQEINLKIQDRKIPMTQLLKAESEISFKEWDLKQDKIRY